MKQPEVLDDLARARSNIATVEVRLAIRWTRPPGSRSASPKLALFRHAEAV